MFDLCAYYYQVQVVRDQLWRRRRSLKTDERCFGISAYRHIGARTWNVTEELWARRLLDACTGFWHEDIGSKVKHSFLSIIMSVEELADVLYRCFVTQKEKLVQIQVFFSSDGMCIRIFEIQQRPIFLNRIHWMIYRVLLIIPLTPSYEVVMRKGKILPGPIVIY